MNNFLSPYYKHKGARSMYKYLPIFISILIIVMSIYSFSSNAYADLFDEIFDGIISNVGKAIEKGIKKSHKQQQTELNKISYQKLDKAMYGIPLNATLEEVLKWCEENSVKICNWTEEEINEYVRENIKYLKKLRTLVNSETASLSDIEKELLKISLSDPMEAAFMADIKEKLNILKRPSFVYKNKKYFWEFAVDSMEIKVNGEKIQCTEEGIKTNTYLLRIRPSENSEKLNRDKVSLIEVLFFKTSKDELKSFLVSGIWEEEWGGKNLEKTLNFIIEVLNKKYGKCHLCKTYSTYKKYRGEFPLCKALREDGIYKDDLLCCDVISNLWYLIDFYIDNVISGSKTLLIWRPNIVLLASSRGRTDFRLIYFDLELAKRVIEDRKTALQKCKTDYYNRQNLLKKEMESDF